MATCPNFVLSVCAGVGAFDLGIEIAIPESRTACFIEREIAAVEILVARMEEGSLHAAPIYSDLLAFDGKPWRGVIHTVIAGLPCQPYSVAGKQLGHDDERAIWPAFIRVVGEVQPEVVYLENVPAFLGYFRPIGNELQRMGYIVEEPLLITASECGASHKRERFFACARKPVAHRTSERLPIGNRAGIGGTEAGTRPNGIGRRGSSGPGGELGNPDIPRLEGRNECRDSTGERITGAAGGELADSLPLFAPGPGATELWQRLLRDHPYLAPAVSAEEAQSLVRSAPSRAPAELDFENRTDQLRALGNLVCPLQAAVAIIMLAQRLQVM